MLKKKEEKTQKKILILGLTGSIGMGKTTVAQIFKKYKIDVFSSDEIIHQLYDEDEVQKKLKKYFLFSQKNIKITRDLVSKEISSSPEKIKILENIFYPLLSLKRQSFLEAKKKEKKKFVVFDIPLLYEKKLTHLVDKILVVDAPEKIQKKRVLSRKNMTEKKFFVMLSRQIPNKEKCKTADYVLNTNTDLKSCEEEVIKLIEILKGEKIDKRNNF